MALPTDFYTPTKLSDTVTVTRIDGGYSFQIQDKEPLFVTNSEVGATSLTRFLFISQKSDFPDSVGGVITLESEYTYFLVNNIDLLGDRLVGGQNTTIIGGSSENCTITSTGLGSGIALLTTEWTTPIRHISFIDVDTAIDIDGTVNLVALDWTGVNFVNVPNIGTLNTCDNFIFTKGAFLNSQGFLVTGTIGTVGLNDSIFVGDGTAGNIIELDASCIITRRFRIVYSSIVASGSSIGVDVDALATIPTEAFILDTVNFSGGGTYLGGLDETSNDSLFVNCVGIQNSAVNGQMYMQDNSTATTVAASSTFYKVAGVTTASADNQKYTVTDNRLTNNATIERKYLIICSLSFTSGNNNICEFGFYDSKLAAVRTPSRTKTKANGFGRAENVSFSCVIQHSENDYIEIHCANNSGTNNITVTDMNVVITEIN